jgi:hypothetical protein
VRIFGPTWWHHWVAITRWSKTTIAFCPGNHPPPRFNALCPIHWVLRAINTPNGDLLLVPSPYPMRPLTPGEVEELLA